MFESSKFVSFDIIDMSEINEQRECIKVYLKLSKNTMEIKKFVSAERFLRS